MIYSKNMNAISHWIDDILKPKNNLGFTTKQSDIRWDDLRGSRNDDNRNFRGRNDAHL